MNGQERVLAVLQGKQPDRIPHFEWSVVNQVLQDAPIWPKLGWSYENVVEMLDIDGVVAWPIYATERLGGDVFRDELGVVRKQGHEDYAVALDEHAPIGGMGDLEGFSFPDPARSLRWVQLKSLVRRFKGERAIIMKLRDVFSWPRDLLGYEKLMMAIATDQELVARLVEITVEYTKQLAEIAVDMGAEVVVTADDIASNHGLIMSPGSFRSLFLPKFRELVEHFHRLGLYVIKHTDGDFSPLVPDFIEAGVDCLDPIDPMAGMDLGVMKREYGHRVALKGNVNCVGVLDGEDKQSIIDETKRAIRQGGLGGGFILSSSNSIHSGISFQNYRLMVETLQRYGTYPLEC